MTAGFVRAARASDAPGLARVQAESWRTSFAGLVPDAVLVELTSEDALGHFTERWAAAISSPPSSKHRVHVAVGAPGEPQVRGFAASGPATHEDLWAGTDGQLYELHVLPALAALAAEGHDGRLLNAVADTFAEDGFRTGYAWALAGDTARIKFLEAAGWAPDGSQASLDMGVKVPVVRLHTRLPSAE